LSSVPIKKRKKALVNVSLKKKLKIQCNIGLFQLPLFKCLELTKSKRIKILVNVSFNKKNNKLSFAMQYCETYQFVLIFII
jgi:hypothetical protein